MRYAIFSDIHGNRQAWEAVVADMEALEVQVLVCLGDVVGYGPCPQEVLRAIRERTENIVVGNHDAAAAGTMDASVFNPVARRAIEWTRGQLDEESLSFLAQMPMAIETEDLLFVHAEVAKPGRFGYIESAEDALHNFAVRDHRVSFVGHTHRPTLFRLEASGTVTQLQDEDVVLEADRRYIVNVGSVGEPRTFDDIRARYVIYDSDTRKLYYRRIEFDPEAYRRELSASGLEITPYFLTVFDHQQAEEAAGYAISAGATAAMAAGTTYGAGPRKLVVPTGAAGETHLMAVPRAQQRTPRRSAAQKVLVVMVPLLAVAVGAILLLALGGGGRNDPGVASEGERPPPVSRQDVEIHGPPLDARRRNQIIARNAAAKNPEGGAEPSSVAVDPVPEPGVPDPAPAPAPGVTPKPPVETVPKLEELTVKTGLGSGLIFYAPLDEAAGTSVARDLSSGGRDLNVGAAQLGEPGQIGQACRIDKSGSLTSAAKVLPAQWEALTIAFWLRLPEMPAPQPGEPVVPEPPGALVTLHEYIDTRLESGQIVANLDRTGEEARVEFPRDGEWHHVMVENADDITTIWIDGGMPSDPRAEILPGIPPGEVSVWIGSAESRFTIDEVAIWNRKLSRDERFLLYRRGEHGFPVLTPARTVAQWSFEDEAGVKLLADSAGDHALGAYKPWSRAAAIAPNPVPLTLKANASAARIQHVGEAPDKAGSFRLRADTPFTYEGWVNFLGGNGGTLGGTISGGGQEAARGWRVAALRGHGAEGHLAFMFENGEGKVQALGKDLILFDNLPHHFAAVWNQAASETEGELILYLDNKEVAKVSLPLSSLQGEDSAGPFAIEANRAPFVLDELRFSTAALTPKLFLTAGLSTQAPADAVPKDESLLERRDRERKEERARQIEERQRKEAERAAELERRRLEEEAKRAEEEAKKNRP